MLTATPHPYQDEAIDGVLDLGYGLVAYEMGLGKTMVGIAVVEELISEPSINFALLIVPSNLRWQWAESIAKFTDVDTTTKRVRKRTLTVPTPEWCTVIDGDPKKRDQQYAYVDKHWPNYVICSYEQVVNDYSLIEALEPECIILDEATAIKGFKAKRSQAVKALGEQAKIRVALSGTPLENKPEEVFSIMEFVEPSILGNPHQFDAKFIVRNAFGGVKRYRNLDILNKKLSGVMFRKTRLDPDVAPYMPKVSHKEEYVFLHPKSQRLYDKIGRMALKELMDNQVTGNFDVMSYYQGGDQDMTAVGKIAAKVMALQMLCDHPDLLKISAQKYYESGGEEGSKFAAQLLEQGLLDDLGRPEKLLAVCDDVKDILESNPENKIIIFSFFKDMGEMIQKELQGYGSVRYNGDMTSNQKSEAKAAFQEDPDVRLFIASDAGAFGVDLPQANYLINYDLVESAGQMDQRNARHVRAGSKHKNVFVINYMIDGSIEERTFQRLNFKRKVSGAVIDGDMDATFSELGEIENDVTTLTDWLADTV